MKTTPSARLAIVIQAAIGACATAAVHDALARWAADELRSLNAQIELLLRRALADAGHMPTHAEGGQHRPASSRVRRQLK